ncbi:MAG: hypothetical protein MZV63_63420 [Marinilabiliales bacterium]|nr:hypothetical protein [Marinilabiliales bacterium]
MGALISLCAIIWKGKFLSSMRNIFWVLISYPLSIVSKGVKPLSLSPENSEKIPFGFAICMGTVWAVVEFSLGKSVFDIINISGWIQ